MKHLVLSSFAALLLVACGQNSAPADDHADHHEGEHYEGDGHDHSHDHDHDHGEAADVPLDAMVVDGVTIYGAIIRPPLGGKDVTAGYMTISSDVDDKIIGAETDAADVVELHTHEQVDGVMRMRKVDAVELHAKETVKFAPKGKHLMLFGIKDVAEGDKVMVSLKLESGKTLDVAFLIAVPEVSAHDEH